MSAPLPSLSRRATRILLLAGYRDVVIEGSRDGGAGGKPDSRLLAHDELWYQGSWDELEAALDRVDRFVRRTFFREHVGVKDPFASKESASVHLVGMLMPDSIYVPPVVSAAYGFADYEAKNWSMPKAEWIRRRDLRPRRVA